MICIADAIITFLDPEWGETSFQLSIWRHRGDSLPDYEVVIE